MGGLNYESILESLPSAQPDLSGYSDRLWKRAYDRGYERCRQDAIDALWKALYEYEDKMEKQFQESDDLDVGEWIGHRIFVQNMSDIDRQTILNLPSAQPEDVIHITGRRKFVSEFDFDEEIRNDS